MFTKEQIQQAQAKVKSGKDFQQLVQEFKAMGILLYEHWVGEEKNIFFGESNHRVDIEYGKPPLTVSNDSSAEKLKQALKIHQAGQTDYPTFCIQSAEAGVEKWVTDIGNMTVTYLDKNGNALIIENIPTL